MGARRSLGWGAPARRWALSCFYRLASNRRLALRACVALFLLGAISPRIAASVMRLRGVGVGPPILTNCGASKYGFAPAGKCHPFTLPKTMTFLDVRPAACGRLSTTGAGFCLCDDDERTTTVANPKGYGTKPTFCERACATDPIVGVKRPACPPAKPRLECGDPASRSRPNAEILATLRAFAEARGPALGVKLPDGTRRDLYKDFVMYDRRMSPRDAETAKRRVEQFVRSAPAYPAGAFESRGIVIVGGASPRFATSYWVAVHALRRAGCELPIEMWFPAGEGPDCVRSEDLQKMGVTVASFADLARSGKDGRGAGEMTDRFMYKINALVFSRFEEVLLLDSDNIALRDPNELFESSLYRERGSLLWMDFWRGSAAPDCAVVLGNATCEGRYTHESGQMLVDKRRSWEALSLALFMNAHSDFFYPLSVGYMGLGDKELVALAFNHLGRRYGLVPHGPDHVGVRDHDRAEVLGNTMMQHSPDGTPFFMHANLGKPTPFVPGSFETYVRRWQASMIHGKAFPRVLNEAAGVDDFERWYYELLRDHGCWFDDRPPKHWYHTLGIGPFVEGFHVSDHYNINDDLEAFREMKEMGVIFG